MGKARKKVNVHSGNDAVKIVIGGKDWYYKTIDDNKEQCVEVYNDKMEFLNTLQSMDEATEWMISKAEQEQRETKEKMQEIFMRNFEKLKGDKSDGDFAVMLGMPQSTVYQYLIGRRFPTVAAVAQIAERCNVSMDWLVGRE